MALVYSEWAVPENLFVIVQEVLRLRAEHPDDDTIENDRVKGKLKVTRAFGAGFLKQVKNFFDCFQVMVLARETSHFRVLQFNVVVWGIHVVEIRSSEFADHEISR